MVNIRSAQVDECVCIWECAPALNSTEEMSKGIIERMMNILCKS